MVDLEGNSILILALFLFISFGIAKAFYAMFVLRENLKK
jgi:hypothetical protein